MKKLILLITILVGSFTCNALSIPADQLSIGSIYIGSAKEFSKPAEIEYQTLVKATPEYQLIDKKKIPSGSGKYWILQAKAGDRVIRISNLVKSEHGYDIVAMSGYLASLTPAIPSVNITKAVEVKIKEEFKSNG